MSMDAAPHPARLPAHPDRTGTPATLIRTSPSTVCGARRLLTVLTLAAALATGGLLCANPTRGEPEGAPVPAAASSVAPTTGASASNGQDPGAGEGWQSIAIGREVGRADGPVLIGSAGDGSGRIFVGERRGRVLAIGGEQAAPRTFLDISRRVAARKGGLRGLAFPFDFIDRRWFVASYVDLSGGLTVSRFRLDAGGAADSSSEQVLLKVPLPGTDRPGGALAFGADGKLYVGIGEGFPAGRSRGEAQSLASLQGKILRIDPGDPSARGANPYSVPPDNPWTKQSGARPELWAIGLGNPSWIGLDPDTGALLIADTLGDRHEEVEVQPGTGTGGENYGWNVMEGSSCRRSGPCPPPGLTLPAATIPGSGGLELVGGAICSGPAHADWNGRTFFGERRSGRLWALRKTETGSWESRMLLDTDLKVAALGLGEKGDVYVADERSGRIFEIVPAAPARKP